MKLYERPDVLSLQDLVADCLIGHKVLTASLAGMNTRLKDIEARIEGTEAQEGLETEVKNLEECLSEVSRDIARIDRSLIKMKYNNKLGKDKKDGSP